MSATDFTAQDEAHYEGTILGSTRAGGEEGREVVAILRDLKLVEHQLALNESELMRTPEVEEEWDELQVDLLHLRSELEAA